MTKNDVIKQYEKAIKEWLAHWLDIYPGKIYNANKKMLNAKTAEEYNAMLDERNYYTEKEAEAQFMYNKMQEEHAKFISNSSWQPWEEVFASIQMPPEIRMTYKLSKFAPKAACFIGGAATVFGLVFGAAACKENNIHVKEAVVTVISKKFSPLVPSSPAKYMSDK